MSIIKTGASAIGKLVIVMFLTAAFGVGLIGVVWLSLRGEAVTVPEVIGKDYAESEREMAALGLKIKKRATRYSQEKPNTVLEQLPKPGDTVKTGQTILVVISEANPEGNEAPATVEKGKNNDEADESTDITPDKAVKSNKNSNVKKPSQTTRDVISNKTNKNTNANSSTGNTSAGNASPKPNSGDGANKASDNKSNPATPGNKTTPAGVKPETSKPPGAAKPPTTSKTPNTSGDVRTRRVP